MTGSKKWYLSKAIWGAIILLVSTILGFFGYTITALATQLQLKSKPLL